MQSIKYNGLLISFNEHYEQYIFAKALLENTCNFINITQNYCHSVYISKNELLSICVYNSQIFIGIINMDNGTIFQNLSEDYIKKITPIVCENLTNRMNNIYNQIDNCQYRPGRLEKLWEEYLQKYYNNNFLIFPNNNNQKEIER